MHWVSYGVTYTFHGESWDSRGSVVAKRTTTSRRSNWGKTVLHKDILETHHNKDHTEVPKGWKSCCRIGAWKVKVWDHNTTSTGAEYWRFTRRRLYATNWSSMCWSESRHFKKGQTCINEQLHIIQPKTKDVGLLKDFPKIYFIFSRSVFTISDQLIVLRHLNCFVCDPGDIFGVCRNPKIDIHCQMLMWLLHYGQNNWYNYLGLEANFSASKAFDAKLYLWWK